jgi:AICAR transformylase/IMP cyclohydrolase PurH
MALASIGGGYQTTDGNLSELTIGVQAAPQTATATATLSVAQITGGLLVADPSGSAATYTLPTTVATEAVVTNAKVDSTFELNIVNLGTSSGALTIAVGTGWTLVGSVTVAITSSARFLARKTGDWYLDTLSRCLTKCALRGAFLKGL